MQTSVNEKGRRTFEMTQDEYHRLERDDAGLCLACGEEAYGVEPDARCYPCEACRARKVFGAQELMMMGRILFTDEVCHG